RRRFLSKILAGSAAFYRQGYCQTARRVLADHADGGGATALQAFKRARLLDRGRSEDVQEPGQYHLAARDEEKDRHGCVPLFSAARGRVWAGRRFSAR